MRTMLVMALSITLALAGCADNGDAGSTGTDTPTDTMTETSGSATETDTDTSAPRGQETWDVDVQDNSFSPADLTIQVGDTVRWTQSGSNPHTVTADDDSFDSHPDCSGFQDSLLGDCMAEGDTFEHTFNTAAEVAYYCRIHGGTGGSGMSGTITVLTQYDETPSRLA